MHETHFFSKDVKHACVSKMKITYSYDLGRENSTELAECIQEIDIGNRFLEILNEYIAGIVAAHRGVTLALHDTAWLILDWLTVHVVEGDISII